MLRKDAAQLAGLFVESVAYGFYIATFGYCLRALLRGRSGWSTQFCLGNLLVVLLLFSMGSVNLGLGFYRIYDIQQHTSILAIDIPARKYSEKSWVSASKIVTLNMHALIADGSLIYRCWEVHGKLCRVVIFPFTLWLAAITFTVTLVWSQFRSFRAYSTNLQCTIFWALTITLNIYTTGAIIYRIWRVDCHSRYLHPIDLDSTRASRRKGRSILQVMRIVVDSGLLYTASSIPVFISQVTRSTAIYITSSVYITTIGITFNLIIIRVADAKLRQSAPPLGERLTELQFSGTVLPGPESSRVTIA